MWDVVLDTNEFNALEQLFAREIDDAMGGKKKKLVITRKVRTSLLEKFMVEPTDDGSVQLTHRGRYYYGDHCPDVTDEEL